MADTAQQQSLDRHAAATPAADAADIDRAVSAPLMGAQLHDGAARVGSGPVRPVVLDGPFPEGSGSDDGEDDGEPSVREQLADIAQMLRTMQFDISALKRSNRR